MSDNKVELKVASDFRKIISDLEGLQKKASDVGNNLKRVTDDLDKNLAKNTKRTEGHFERLRDLGRRLADQLRGYFANVASHMAKSLELVKKDLGLKQQFIDATKGAIDLHDTIRKIGGSLDIATDRLGEFQRNLTKAFGEAGFDADTAGRALAGIAGTQVSGEKNAQEYALTAAKLAQAGGETGQEGAIAKALTDVLRTVGIDQNDLGAMSAYANSVRGRNPLEKLQIQNEMYGAMEPSQRGKFSPDTMAGLAAVRKEVGPEMDAFIRKMTQGWLEKLPQTAQGLGKILGPGGIDFDEVRKNSGLLKRLGNDTNASGATLGLSPDEARGLFALLQHADRAQAAQERGMNRVGTLDDDVRSTRGLGENAAAVKAQVTGAIGQRIAKPLGIINDVIGKASETTAGSAGIMAGGFAVAGGAAALLNKIGGGKIAGAAGTGARMAALEQITGQKTVPVYVTNVGEFNMGGFGGGGAVGGAAAVAGTGVAIAAGIVGGLTMLRQAGEDLASKKRKGGTAMEQLTDAGAWAEGMNKQFDSMTGNLFPTFKALAAMVEDISRNMAKRGADAKAADTTDIEMRKREALEAQANGQRTGAAVATPNIGNR